MKISTQKIEMLLAEQGMTQKALSERSNLTRQSVSAIIKRGTCEPITAGKLASGLGVAIADIIEQEEN